MTDRYELASAIFGTKRAETDPSTLSTAIITGTAVEDSESGMVRIIPDGNVIAPDGEDNSIVLPTSPNVKSGDNVIIISTGGTATTPIVAGASGSGDRLLAGIDGIETLIRETADGVLVAKVGQTVGALVNADGSFDVVALTWDGSEPTVGDAISEFSQGSAYVGAFREDGSYQDVSGNFYVLPMLNDDGSISFASFKVSATINKTDLSESISSIETGYVFNIKNGLGTVRLGHHQQAVRPHDPWLTLTPNRSTDPVLVNGDVHIGSYHPNIEDIPIVLGADGTVTAQGGITAESFTGNPDYSFANANLCSQSASDWEQGGISSTGANLNRTHTIRLSAASRMEVTGGTPYYFDIQDGYTVNVKPYTSAGTFYEDPNLAAQHIQRYPFIWVPTQDGYLRLTCTIDGSTALAPSGIETALPVVRKASAADFAAVIYAMELNGYAY
jgi:hypothetical protein